MGHSTFLIQCDGLNILTDPIWSDRCAPVQWAGPRRIVPPGVSFDELPPIDVVLQSHDHYDHFDDWSVRAIARAHPGARWHTPLGVARRLTARGVRHVTALDWWQRADADGVQVTCVPAQHFSGRTPFDRNLTLWSGFVLRIHERTIYFVGDTGYHDGFGDLTAPHPASTPVMVAMHWGTFVLTDEPVDEPPVRARTNWSVARLPDDRLWIMAPGETRQTAP